MHHISTGNCCILKSVIQGFDLGQGMQYRLLIHQFYAGFSSTYFLSLFALLTAFPLQLSTS